MELSPSLPTLPIGITKINDIDRYMNEISASIHIYNKVDTDLMYNSEFIRIRTKK